MSARQYKQWIVGFGIFVFALFPLVVKEIGAEEYPAKTIKIICGFAAGGSLDRQVRLVLPFFQKHLGKSVMIENLTGAQAILASNKVFSSPPDGYTLLIAGTYITLQEKLLPETCHYKSLDFTHVFSLVREDGVLLGHPEVWKNYDEFSKAAQSKRLRVGISGRGTPTHLYIIMLEEMTGLKFNIIPFEGGGPSMTALAGKHVDGTSTVVSGSFHLIRSGTLNPLLVFSDRRHPALPHTPIPKEVGYESFEPFAYIQGILGPPKLPADRVKVLEEAFAKAVKEPEFLEKCKEMAVEVYPLNSRDFLAKSEKAYYLAEKYTKILKGL